MKLVKDNQMNVKHDRKIVTIDKLKARVIQIGAG